MHRTTATDLVKASPRDFALDQFNASLAASGEQQAIIFDAVEALLAAWARLSLLFHPIGGKGDLAAWRVERGKTLRFLLDLPADSLLSQREFRDAWMHFDERLDEAYQSAWLGNRQEFVMHDTAAGAVGRTVRVIVVEMLVFHYRDKSGQRGNVAVADLDRLVRDLVERLEHTSQRIGALPAPLRN